VGTIPWWDVVEISLLIMIGAWVGLGLHQK